MNRTFNRNERDYLIPITCNPNFDKLLLVPNQSFKSDYVFLNGFDGYYEYPLPPGNYDISLLFCKYCDLCNVFSKAVNITIVKDEQTTFKFDLDEVYSKSDSVLVNNKIKKINNKVILNSFLVYKFNSVIGSNKFFEFESFDINLQKYISQISDTLYVKFLFSELLDDIDNCKKNENYFSTFKDKNQLITNLIKNNKSLKNYFSHQLNSSNQKNENFGNLIKPGNKIKRLYTNQQIEMINFLNKYKQIVNEE